MGLTRQHRTLASVASAMSRQYGVKVICQGNQAKTDGKTITIPTIASNDENYDVLCRGYIDHETGHIRFTKFSALYGRGLNNVGSFKHSLWNIYEDVYIERKMGEYFPGCKTNLMNLQDVVFKEVPEIKSLHVIDRLWYILASLLGKVRGLDHYGEVYDKANEIFPGIVDALTPFVELSKNTSSTDDCVDLALRTYDAIRKYISDLVEQDNNGGSNDGQQGHSGEGEGNADDGNKEGEQDNSGKGEGNPDGDGEDSEQGNTGTDNKDQSAKGRKIRNLINTILGSNEDVLIGTNETNKLDIGEKARCLVNDGKETIRIMKVGVKEHIDLSELPEILVSKSDRMSVYLDANLRGLLQARSITRGGGLKSDGRLDTRQLYRLATGSSRLFRRAGTGKTIDTEVLILMDGSGSMDEYGRQYMALGGSYAMMKSLRRVPNCHSSLWQFKEGTIFPLIRVYDKLTTKIYEQAEGGTACGIALQLALAQFKTDSARKICLIVTDGETCKRDVPAMDRVPSLFREAGVELVGIGIGTHTLEQYIPDAAYVDRMETFGNAVFAVLGKVLLS